MEFFFPNFALVEFCTKWICINQGLGVFEWSALLEFAYLKALLYILWNKDFLRKLMTKSSEFLSLELIKALANKLLSYIIESTKYFFKILYVKAIVTNIFPGIYVFNGKCLIITTSYHDTYLTAHVLNLLISLVP